MLNDILVLFQCLALGTGNAVAKIIKIKLRHSH